MLVQRRVALFSVQAGLVREGPQQRFDVLHARHLPFLHICDDGVQLSLQLINAPLDLLQLLAPLRQALLSPLRLLVFIRRGNLPREPQFTVAHEPRVLLPKDRATLAVVEFDHHRPTSLAAPHKQHVLSDTAHLRRSSLRQRKILTINHRDQKQRDFPRSPTNGRRTCGARGQAPEPPTVSVANFSVSWGSGGKAPGRRRLLLIFLCVRFSSFALFFHFISLRSSFLFGHREKTRLVCIARPPAVTFLTNILENKKKEASDKDRGTK